MLISRPHHQSTMSQSKKFSTWGMFKSITRRTSKKDVVQEERDIPTAHEEIILRLHGRELVYQDGKWSLGPGDGIGDDSVECDAGSFAKLTDLRERNEMLRFKVDLLLDRLSLITLDADEAERRLKSQRSKLSAYESHEQHLQGLMQTVKELVGEGEGDQS